MLYIHTSNHLEQLKKQYAELVQTPLKKVFKTETVVVQNAGMARWLSIQMAGTSGISANTEYLFPAEYMWRLLRLVTPEIPEYSQCAPDTLRFHIYDELINNGETYPELDHYIYKNHTRVDKNATDANALDKILDELSVWELACQTARLLDQYLFYRSDWIKRWEDDESDHWQARLWNNCVKQKGLLHWLKLQDQFSINIESIDTRILEERVSFFSMSALSPGYIDLLSVIAEKTDIHIFIINPCKDVYWGDIDSPKIHAKLEQEAQAYSDIGNPLLASLGKQGRDFIDKLISLQNQESSDDSLDQDFLETNTADTLLAQIQEDIKQLEYPSFHSQNTELFLKNDDSIKFHSCHTAMREVEILHDQILAQLDKDENLAPKDIVVMMPDIEKYAPYIESVFANNNNDKQQKLPFSIADRDPQNIFKMIQALNKLFCLTDSRFDVEAVFELLEYDDIRRHFGLNQEQLHYCRELALATNIRWGISAKTRKQNDLPDTEEHTWKYALDRMLLGYAIADSDTEQESPLFASKRNLKLLPFNEIEGSNALILAKFKKFTDVVFDTQHWMNQRHSLDQWILKTKHLIQQLSPENNDQQRLKKTLADIQVKATLADFAEELSFDVFHKILKQALYEISANEKYLGYGITFCALVPMRSVPFKLVVLMGMNDGEFPRQDSPTSFDLMSNKKRKGDRSRRDEDRYLFLESILAAREKIIISFIGQSIKDNTELAPSILVSELLDTLSIITASKTEDWIVKHPLQAFSARYFKNNEGQDALFSYASEYIELNKQLTINESSDKQTAFLNKRLDELDDSHKQLDLNDLIRFYKNPAKAFLKSRFAIQTYNDEKQLSIREPFDIESFKDREIRNLIHSNCASESNLTELARAKGLLPYGEIGDNLFAKEKHSVDIFIQQLPEFEALSDQKFTLNIGDFIIHTNINQLSTMGRAVIQLSKPFAGDYISLWLNHLCLNTYINQTKDSLDPSLLGLTSFYSPEISFQLEAIEDAEQQLSVLLDNYWDGFHFPLQFFPKSAFALYNKYKKENLNESAKKWNGDDRYAGEKDSFEHYLLHRDIEFDKTKQPESFLHLSQTIFGKLFSVYTEL